MNHGAPAVPPAGAVRQLLPGRHRPQRAQGMAPLSSSRETRPSRPSGSANVFPRLMSGIVQSETKFRLRIRATRGV